MESSEFGLQSQHAGNVFIENGDSSSPASAAADQFSVDQFLNMNADNTEDDETLLTAFPHQQSNQLYSEFSDFASSPAVLQPKFSDFASSPPLLQQPSTAAGGNLGFLLTLPEEEPGLEWISYFLEESFSQFNHAAGASLNANPMPERASPPPYSSPQPSNAPHRSQRSKRLRPSLPASRRVWRQAAPSSSLTESTTTSSPSSSATSLPYWPTSPTTPLAFKDRNKKRRRRKKGRVGPGPEPGPVPGSRRCSHCGIQKTPLWRAGPMGAKTLCNACGVRFKSGRLLPEYRPACSPTFSTQLHSNSHRKVMEMRRKKEMVMVGQIEPAFPKFG